MPSQSKSISLGLTSVDTATVKLHFENLFPLEKNSALLNGSPQEARGTDWQLCSTLQKVSWNLPMKGILITLSPEARAGSPILPIKMLEESTNEVLPKTESRRPT